MTAPMMPHLAESCWEALGHTTMVVETPWPKADPSLVRSDTVAIAVQVNGKRRGEIVTPVNAPEDQMKTAALVLEGVVRALEGKTPKKIIIVPNRHCEHRRMSARPLLALPLLLVLGGCGFHPLYGGYDDRVGGTLATIYVEPIPDRLGYELRNNADRHAGFLRPRGRRRLSAADQHAQKSEGIALQNDATITRYNDTLNVTYELTQHEDRRGGGQGRGVGPVGVQRRDLALRHLRRAPGRRHAFGAGYRRAHPPRSRAILRAPHRKMIVKSSDADRYVTAPPRGLSAALIFGRTRGWCMSAPRRW